MTWPSWTVRLRLTARDTRYVPPAIVAAALVIACGLALAGLTVAASFVLSVGAVLAWVAWVADEVALDARRAPAAGRLNVNGVAWAQCRECERMRPVALLTKSGVCKVPCAVDEPVTGRAA